MLAREPQNHVCCNTACTLPSRVVAGERDEDAGLARRSASPLQAALSRQVVRTRGRRAPAKEGRSVGGTARPGAQAGDWPV